MTAIRTLSDSLFFSQIFFGFRSCTKEKNRKDKWNCFNIITKSYWYEIYQASMVQFDQGLWWGQEGNRSIPFLKGNYQTRLVFSHSNFNAILQVLDGDNEKTKYDIHTTSALHIATKQLKTVDHLSKYNLVIPYLRANNMHNTLNGQCIDTTANQP